MAYNRISRTTQVWVWLKSAAPRLGVFVAISLSAILLATHMLGIDSLVVDDATFKLLALLLFGSLIGRIKTINIPGVASVSMIESVDAIEESSRAIESPKPVTQVGQNPARSTKAKGEHIKPVTQKLQAKKVPMEERDEARQYLDDLYEMAGFDPEDSVSRLTDVVIRNASEINRERLPEDRQDKPVKDNISQLVRLGLISEEEASLVLRVINVGIKVKRGQSISDYDARRLIRASYPLLKKFESLSPAPSQK